DPRNHHRPALDTPVTIDALLEGLPFQDVLERHLHALLVALAVDQDGPRRRLALAGVHRRLVLVAAELVVVAVGGDVFPLVRPLFGAELALLDVFEPAAVRRRRRGLQYIGAEHASGRGANDGAGARANELAPIQIELLVGDFGAADVRRALDEHGVCLFRCRAAARVSDPPIHIIIRTTPQARRGMLLRGQIVLRMTAARPNNSVPMPSSFAASASGCATFGTCT